MIWEEPYDRSALEGNLSDFDQSVTLHADPGFDALVDRAMLP
jgi:hypothetical protein